MGYINKCNEILVNYIKENKPLEINDNINIVGNYKPSKHSCGRVITSNGICPAIMEITELYKQ